MKKTKILVLVLTAAISVCMSGCGKIHDKVSEEVGEGIVAKAVGGNVDITKDGIKVQKDGASIETGDDLKWPKSSMGDLPEPKAKITGILNGKATEGCTVVLSDMSFDVAKEYVEMLKELGYQDGLSISEADGISYGGRNKGGASAMISYNASPKEGTIGYTPAEANKSN